MLSLESSDVFSGTSNSVFILFTELNSISNSDLCKATVSSCRLILFGWPGGGGNESRRQTRDD